MFLVEMVQAEHPFDVNSPTVNEMFFDDLAALASSDGHALADVETTSCMYASQPGSFSPATCNRPRLLLSVPCCFGSPYLPPPIPPPPLPSLCAAINIR